MGLSFSIIMMSNQCLLTIKSRTRVSREREDDESIGEKSMDAFRDLCPVEMVTLSELHDMIL
jgi:hypothetical protein